MTTQVKHLNSAGNKRGINPNSLKNLVAGRAKLAGIARKGKSPNPTGYSVTARLKKLLIEHSDFIPPHANPYDKIYRDQIARTIIKESACGNVPMIKELLDRTDGKVPDKTLPINPGSQVLNIIVVGGGDNLKDILAQVKERTKLLAMGEAQE